MNKPRLCLLPEPATNVF